MKPFYTKATNRFDNSITIRYVELKALYPHWHYHEEYEIVFIHKSYGTRYVGDSISPYKSGDLALLGSNLPHIWINRPSKKDEEPNRAAITVIHIQRNFIHNGFFELPLMDKVNSLFKQASYGIKFIDFEGIEQLLDSIHTNTSTERIIAVMQLLAKLSTHKQIELLSSYDYQKVASEQRSERLLKIHEYIANHFRKKISLDTLAELVHMTSPAFCSYFKNKTNKTVFTYINDLKIGYSSKLLIDGNLNIDQIAYESGFNSTTFFNRKFKEKMQMTPKAYRKKFEF